MHRARHTGQAAVIPPTTLDAAVRPAFDRGHRKGLPGQPPLIAALLALSGEPLARRMERLLALNERAADPGLPLPFPVPVTLLRETLLWGGAEVTELTELTERAERLLAVAELLQARGTIVSRRLMAWRHEIAAAGLDPKDRRPRSHLRCKREAARLRESRAKASQEVAALFEQLLRAGVAMPDLPALTEQILQFAEVLLTYSAPSTFVLTTIRKAVEQCLSLPEPLRRNFFALACEDDGALWRLSEHPKREDSDPKPKEDGCLSALGRNQWLVESSRLGDLLRTAEDADVVRAMMRLGLYEVAHSQVSVYGADADHLRLLVRLMRDFGPGKPPGTYCALRNAVIDHLQCFPTGEQARAALRPLERTLRAAAQLPERRPAARRVLISLLNAAPTARGERRLVLTRLAGGAEAFVPWAERASDAAWESYEFTLASGAVLLAREHPDRLPAFFTALVKAVPTDTAADEAGGSPCRITALAVSLAAALAGESAERFAALLALATPLTQEDDSFTYQDWLRQGIRLLARSPDISGAIAALFPAQPRRCLTLLRQIGRATHLGTDVLEPLEECRFDGGDSADSAEGEWQGVLALYPELAPLVAGLWRAQWLLGVPADVAPGIRRVLRERTRRAAELAYSEDLCAAGGDVAPKGLFARRDNLRARLSTDGPRTDTAREVEVKEVEERLRHAVSEARLAAAERQASACFRERLRQAIGSLPARFSLTPDLENATVLAFTITKNRKPLIRLLRAAVSGDPDPFEDHPGNVAFRGRLAESGADVGAWRDAAPRRVVLPGSSRTLHLALETDPLHVLQMGSYFGTCLSAGSGFNAFSTVANAIEQNKRVLFGRDDSGRVIARKLIGISESGELVGFYTYCSLSEEDGADAVRAAIREYLTEFAARCRLPLADAGTVPTLFAESWYDDGAVPWSDEQGERKKTPTPAPSPVHRRGDSPAARVPSNKFAASENTKCASAH
jgi:hypothetical protein